MPQTHLPETYAQSVRKLDALFSYPGNFGIVRRELTVCGCSAVLYYAEGLCDTAVNERVIAFCKESASLPLPVTAEAFCAAHISYTETEISDDPSVLHAGCVTGCLLLLLSAYPTRGILIKARNIPGRSPEEPEHDRVLRGAHVGFVEVLARSCAMLRRQLPTPSLVMKHFQIGAASRTNVVMCYLRGRADERYLAVLSDKISCIRTDNLCMGTQSLAECLIRTRVWNPFPRFRYTERPDAAAASLCEGSIVLLVDGAPQAMILPVSIFSFLQETNDFYLAPLTATYLRIVRILSYIVSLYLVPVWYTFVTHTPDPPALLSFLVLTEKPAVPILVQLLLIETAVDMLKLASMNTPNALSNSLSVIGGLILGEFAIEVGWVLPETILYMAIVSITHFTQHNYELGYAFKFTRSIMLVLCALCGWWGILLGTVLLITLIVTVPTVDGGGRYFYPLIPFDGPALGSLLIRRRKELP